MSFNLPDPASKVSSPAADAIASGAWPDRLRMLLLDAALELAGPHDRDAVLQRIVEGDAAVADARDAALGVYDAAGLLATFVHHGFDESTVEATGRPRRARWSTPSPRHRPPNPRGRSPRRR